MDVKQCQTTKAIQKNDDKDKKPVVLMEVKYTEDETKCLTELRKLYLDTIKLDAALQRDIYNLEKSYEARHDIVYDKRKKLLEDFKKVGQGGDSGAGNLNRFWLRVLKVSYTEFISKQDENVLVHLMDIRTKLYNDPVVKFVVEFAFEPNEFFTNKVLEKTYYLNCLPDNEDPWSYDGAEIFKCEGCKIHWKKENRGDDGKPNHTSFFDFFNPPTLPDNVDDPNYCDINAILQNDFELGFYLKERVIPKAVLFFTGEIADCQSSDSDSDSAEDDGEDDEDNSSANSASIASPNA